MMARTITLTSDATTQWQPILVVTESPVELDEEDAKRYHKVPNSRIDFLCVDVADPTRQALIAMFVQIPFQGTEFTPPAVRAQQASETVSKRAMTLLSAYCRLQAGKCKHTPAFLGTLKEKQAQDGWVPGGYAFFLGFTWLPGVKLGTGCVSDGLFYELPLQKRDEIREAFRVAYTSMAACGVREWLSQSPKHLLWDEDTRKVYFVGDFAPTEETWEWGPVWWERWRLDEGHVRQRDV
ncbi:hypothetical protein BO78DRAFT_305021 [Aspergillus sclerotiicarbonarius CBS 121057]|uniref:Uncharacterized protein n=1 Tax=Aspergillus sclerotiicarbonarius (strain CBS 121057 / IBT 28362) TaxID=1448318 RepID=A0A319ETN5_ASPSB|nr:hypothetical protein BO78DRAFT_305021 [Aspergillus sclerotiicarbonarius CBS 121057]